MWKNVRIIQKGTNTLSDYAMPTMELVTIKVLMAKQICMAES
jgi:hypothetical protein